MWVEVLAAWRGLSFNITNDNQSFWEHYSSVLVNTVNQYAPPPDVGTALFVVWVNNADMYWNITTYQTYDDSNLSTWTNANNQWLSNHFTVITNLYSKGVRTLLMPNAVDLTKTPEFSHYGLTEAEKDWIRQRTIEFDSGFRIMLNQAVASLPGLTIYSPDIFTLFDAVLANPTNYGMINPGVDALEDPALSDKSLDGPGADYVSWDFIHPTAKFQMLFAEAARKLIWPAEISFIGVDSGTSFLHAINIPIGREVEDDGQVEGSTNLADWVDVQSFERTNTTETIAVPVSGPMEFYRLRFPSNWVWP